jgi:eukaryotic-like serine/threonine-protein kinase
MASTTDILPPRYRDPQRIARGGMGEIYHATDSTLGRPVAVKLLAEAYAEDESIRSRFTREALAAARLSGEPNVLTIFDVGEWNERPYIVMEYLPGGSLEEVARRDGGLEPSQVLTWLEQAGGALDAAHRNGIVHRDVKPANLLLNRDGDVHVADFGIARAAGLDALTKPGTVLGTAGYLSPEQARGEQATPASDRYALAVVAFELLTGSRPFARNSPTAEATAHVNEPVPAISSRRPDLPPELDGVFERALAKDPRVRYATCADFVGAVRAALEAGAGTTRVLPPVPVPSGPRRPRGWPVALVALLSAGVSGVVLAVVLTRDGDETTATEPQTLVRTVTAPGTTSEVTVTAEPPPPPPPATPPATPPPTEASGAELNDQGFALMQQGNFEAALPLLEQAVQKLSGTGDATEAYALYNLAATRVALGSCEGVLDLVDRSEQLQGRRREFKQVRKACRGDD